MQFKLIVFDMDGVIFQDDNFWLSMHVKYKTESPGFELTGKYLKTDIKKLADEVIGKLWKGKDAEGFFDLIKNAQYNFGAKQTVEELKQMGFTTCILTSGPVQLAERAKEELGIDYVYGNEIIIKDGKITGEYNWLSLDYSHKGETFLRICKELGFKPEEAVVVGDNDQDIYKFEKAGFSIAFNAVSIELKRKSDLIIEDNNLMNIVEVLK